MMRVLSRRVFTGALAIAMATAHTAAATAADATLKVAFWNVMSGKGVNPLPGHPTPFQSGANCTDPVQPLNAWGVGASQTELAKIAADPSLVALGITDSWTNGCASPEAIRQALGWKAHTSEQNGVSLVARYGFAGAEQWQALDTSLNTLPGDTMWVLRMPVCLDAACAQSMPVYVAHWSGTGANASASYSTQAQQTVTFLKATAGGLPHILLGELNVWEGVASVCGQAPDNTALSYLRAAGYLDAWLTLQGSTEGYTGLANLPGCGFPEGNTWKRIDYAWTLPTFAPLDIQRFAVTPAGDASPSAHYGIVVTLPNPAPIADAAVTAMWTSVVKATATGATLQKTTGCGECFDAGAIGTQPVTAGGNIVFSVAAGQRLLVGLNGDMSASTSYVLDYAFSFWPGGTWEIREKNAYKVEGVYTAADQFTIAVEGTTVKYYKNGALAYASLAPVSGPLVMDTSLASIGATVQNLASAVAPPPPPPAPATSGVVWTSIVRSTAAGSALQKIAGCNDCFDAGAVSQQQIAATGSVSFRVAAGQREIVGLSRDTSASTGYTMDYAFSFWPAGTYEIREGNVYRTEAGFAAGDLFKIAVAAGVAKYYKNDVLLYTSKVPVTGPLVVDTSLASNGAAVQSATVTIDSVAPVPAPLPTNTPPTLRLLQWNTHHGGFGTDGVYSPERIATWVAAMNPDVVMFNEIERLTGWGNQDQPEVYKNLLQQKTGKTWFYVFAQEYGQWSANGKGNLILSTVPFESSTRYELVNNLDRSIASAVITWNGQRITLLQTHLDPDSLPLRLAQAQEVTGWAATQPGNRILTGDMNAWPDQSSIAYLATLYDDSWSVALAKSTAVAFPGNDGQTRNGRIDYIFSAKGSPNLTVLGSQVYDTRDAAGVMPSDHRPVLTTFSVR